MAYYVYLLSSGKHGTLYLGVTRDLVRRVYQHKTKATPGFTSRYDVIRLSGLKPTTIQRMQLLARRKSRNGDAIGKYL